MRTNHWMLGLFASMLLAGSLATAADDQPPAVSPTAKTPLFNGKDYSGWIKFAPDAEVDVDKVWTIQDGLVHCTGKPNGYIRTKQRYQNYRLHVEWRWVDEPTNSGVLLHAELPDQVWPKNVEAQIMHQNAGDFWMLSYSTIEDQDGKTIGPKEFANLKKREDCSEKAPGEWNAYDIVCDGGRVKLTVNGVFQNEGFKANPDSGYICLQSEGSPIQFRNVYMEPLKK